MDQFHQMLHYRLKNIVIDILLLGYIRCAILSIFG
jgi:hypothetical protein